MTLFTRACRPALALLFALIAFWPAGASAQKMAACRPVETAVFQNRIHVRCETPVDKRFPFFAVSTVDPRSANRFLSVAQTAQVTERFVMIDFDSNDTSGSAFGCGADNCRVARAILLIDEVPSACAIDSNAKGCPGFCPSVNNNDISCPGYCDSHDDRACANFCDKHPKDNSCKDKDPCQGPNAHHIPACNH